MSDDSERQIMEFRLDCHVAGSHCTFLRRECCVPHCTI